MTIDLVIQAGVATLIQSGELVERERLAVGHYQAMKLHREAGLAESLAPAPRPPEFRTPEPRSDWVVPLDARFTFDTFVVGKPNEFAHACARRVAERPASPGFNPRFL